MNALRRFHQRERGQAVVLIAFVILGLLMFAGIATDAGQLYSARRTMQEAADAGTYAAAVAVYQGGTKSASGACGATATDPTTDAYKAAAADATRNGFTNGLAGQIVTINNPPRSGSYCGDARYTELIIETDVKTTLVPAEAAFTHVRVRSVAGAEPLNNGFAIMVLDRGMTASAFYDGPNVDIHLAGGGILVNSTSPTAAVNSQTSCTRFTISTPSGVDIAGNTASVWPNCPPPNNFEVLTGQPQVADPFAGYLKPSTNGLLVCAALNAPGCQDLNGHQNPGIYLVTIGGAANKTITLNPGIYILEAGINAAGNANIVGAPGGVFLFNTKTNYPSPGASDTCGSINLVGNGLSSLQAMTSGPYANMLVYQDPVCTAGMVIAGNGTFDGSGTIYLPSAPFTFDGNNATLTGSQLIAKTVNLQNGNITIDFSSGNTAQPILPRLSE